MEIHCVKSVQIRSFFWSVFSRIRTEYVKIRNREDSVSGHFSHSDILDLLKVKLMGGAKSIFLTDKFDHNRRCSKKNPNSEFVTFQRNIKSARQDFHSSRSKIKLGWQFNF